jgi:hypothetical protein
MKTLTVRLPAALLADLESESRDRHCSKSDIVRERLRLAARPRLESASDSIADLVGAVVGLPPDLSGRKKAYLKLVLARVPMTFIVRIFVEEDGAINGMVEQTALCLQLSRIEGTDAALPAIDWTPSSRGASAWLPESRPAMRRWPRHLPVPVPDDRYRAVTSGESNRAIGVRSGA